MMFVRTYCRLLSGLMFGVFALLVPCLSAHADLGKKAEPTKVRLQLKWKHQFQFAGYYAAIENGYYKEAGLEVDLIEAAESVPPHKNVLTGRADFGIEGIELLKLYSSGHDVVMLAPIFQSTAHVIIARTDSQIHSLQDLAKKPGMINIAVAEELFLLRNGDAFNQPDRTRNHSYTLDPFISGEVAYMSAYTSNEPFLLQQLGIPFRILPNPSTMSSFYGDCLYTTGRFLQANPELAHRFVEASLKGWRFALENPDEVLQIIQRKYQTHKSQEHLLFEAQELSRLINPTLVPVGFSNPDRWEATADALLKAGVLHAPLDLTGFLYVPTSYVIPPWAIPITAASVLAATVMGIIVRKHQTVGRLLRREIAERSAAEDKLRQSELRYRLLAENASDLIWTTNTAGQITYVSPSLFPLLGYTQEQGLQMAWKDLVSQHSLDAVETHFHQTQSPDANSPRTHHSIEVLMKRCDGTGVWTEWIAHLYHDAVGDAQGILCVARNIEERRRDEKRLWAKLRYEQGLSDFAKALQLVESGRSPIEESLQHLQSTLHVSRAYIFDIIEHPDSGPCWRHLHEACAADIEPHIQNPDLQAVPFSALPHWLQTMKSGRCVQGPVASLLDPEKTMLDRLGILSIYCLPIMVDGTWFGFLGVDEYTTARVWNDAENRLLQTATDMLQLYYSRRRANKEMMKALEDLRENNRFMTGRELRILDLKQEINSLMSELGRPKKYDEA